MADVLPEASPHSTRMVERQAAKLLVEFRGAIRVLPTLPQERLEEVVVQCCETSRDIRMLVGDPAEIPEPLRLDIGEAFWRAADTVRALSAESQLLNAYAGNIEIRAALFAPRH